MVPGLFLLLVTACTPWLVAASRQSLPVSSHGCLPPVAMSAHGLLCACARVYVCACARVYVRTYVFVHMCVYVCMYVCVCMISHSVVSDSMRVPMGCVAHQAPLSMGFSRQEYWSGLPFPPPGDLPDPGIEPTSSAPPALWQILLQSHLRSPPLSVSVSAFPCSPKTLGSCEPLITFSSRH